MNKTYKTKKTDNMKIFFNPFLFTLLIFNVFLVNSQSGCTDTLANNYDPTATTNNGNCMYDNTTISPTNSIVLSNLINETSGLLEWNGYLYTHNDNSDTNLYKLNKTTGEILQTIALPNVQNIDWENLAQDNTHIYIGDFGNNASGNRTNLKIYKILKNSLETSPIIEEINFSYSNQTNFLAQTANNTDFDCEAFVVTSNEIILFTKQWVSGNTSIYSLPKTVGSHNAMLLTTINNVGLITGATIKEDVNLIAMCGYSSRLSPFIYLLYDFTNTNFSTANKRKININFPFHQVEGISTSNGIDYFITNENFVNTTFGINNPQKLHIFSLANFLNPYLSSLTLNEFDNKKYYLYPNPTNDLIYFNNISEKIPYIIFNNLGKVIKEGEIENNKLNIDGFKSGVYFLKNTKTNEVFKIIKN